ncbi:hypothetical protein B0J14DRAFT_652953 [Halenospora varia]|nr:hypothetical protein B0J14DRAFT_652953 [Halenospora varia]
MKDSAIILAIFTAGKVSYDLLATPGDTPTPQEAYCIVNFANQGAIVPTASEKNPARSLPTAKADIYGPIIDLAESLSQRDTPETSSDEGEISTLRERDIELIDRALHKRDWEGPVIAAACLTCVSTYVLTEYSMYWVYKVTSITGRSQVSGFMLAISTCTAPGQPCGILMEFDDGVNGPVTNSMGGWVGHTQSLRGGVGEAPPHREL